MSRRLTVATRRGELAIAQTQAVIAALKAKHPDVDVRIREITTATPTVPAFAGLAAKVTATDTAVNALEAKNVLYNAAVQSSSTLLTEVGDARVAAEAAVRSLANAAEGETTDEAELLGGGWHLASPPTPVGAMPAPQNLSATGGDLEGEVDMQCEPVPDRDTYLGEWAADPNLGIPSYTAAIQANPDVKLIAYPGGQALGNAPAYMESAGKKPGDIINIGFDTSPQVVQAFKDGWVQLTSDQQPFLQGYMPILSLCQQVVYGLGAMSVDTGAGFVTTENYEAVSTLATEGLR